MAFLDSNGVQYLWNKIKALIPSTYAASATANGVATKSAAIPSGTVDSTSTATAFTATVDGITALADGVCVMLKNGKVTSASGCTLNINGLGAKPIYNTMAASSRVTTAWNVAYTMLFVYNSTRVSGGCWDMYYGINTTYSALTVPDMEAGTATTGRLISAARLKAAVEYHAPVTSVNGDTGDVTVYVPTTISSFTNDSNYVTSPDVEDLLRTLRIYATDATSKAVVDQVFGSDALIVYPSTITNALILTGSLEPRTWFAWMNGTELELARLDGSMNTSTSAITLYLRGRTSIATGTMGVDSAWTVSALASDAEGVAY